MNRKRGKMGQPVKNGIRYKKCTLGLFLPFKVDTIDHRNPMAIWRKKVAKEEDKKVMLIFKPR